MDEANGGDDTRSEDLRKALQMAVIGICEKEEEDPISSSAMSGQAIQVLTELTFLYATTSLARDLDAFSTHAKRQTITADDVKLVARKNPDILEKLEHFCEEHHDRKAAKASRKKSAGSKGNNKKRAGPDSMFGGDSTNSSSDEASDLELDQRGTKPTAAERKRPRPPTAAKSINLRSDSSSSSDDCMLKEKPYPAAAANNKKAAASETIHLDDSSSSSSDDEIPVTTKSTATKKTSNSEMLKMLENSLSHLSDSDEDED